MQMGKWGHANGSLRPNVISKRSAAALLRRGARRLEACRAGGAQARRVERFSDTGDFGGRQFDQRRPHDRSFLASQQDQSLFHAVVHVGERVAVEHLRGVPDALGQRLGARKVVGLHGVEQRHLQIGNHRAGARQ